MCFRLPHQLDVCRQTSQVATIRVECADALLRKAADSGANVSLLKIQICMTMRFSGCLGPASSNGISILCCNDLCKALPYVDVN